MIPERLASLDWNRLALHGAVWRDDFCQIADELRGELVRYPGWKPMRTGHGIDYERQTGITTGHIVKGRPPELELCQAFAASLRDQATDLASLVGATLEAQLAVETNGMAYGQGAWLSRHSDEQSRRRVAWILYLTDPGDAEWPEDWGGALVLSSDDHRVVLRPRFNRFAAFRVSPTSWHEITRVQRQVGWEQARLALSGWIVSWTEAPA